MNRTDKISAPAIPNAKKKIQRVEQSLQIVMFDVMRALWATGCEDFNAFAIGNGGKRTKAEGGIFKAMGVKAGVADFAVMFHGGKIVWVEMKTPTGKTSLEQDEFLECCQRLGFDHRFFAPANEYEAKAMILGLLREYGVRC
jgi:hypothetical protein